MLDVLGLDTLEERVYRRLVSVPSESADLLAASLSVDASGIAVALEALESKGLVARSMATPEHFVASPPAVALGSLIVQRQEDVRRAQLELTVLAEQYRGSAAERTVNDVVDVVRGPQVVAQRFGQLQRGARQQVQALVKSQIAVVSPEENVQEDVALSRGVGYQVVLERSAFDRPGFADLAGESLAAGEQVRVTGDVPLRMIVADRQLGLLPLQQASDDSGAGALLVHPSGLLDAMLALFDMVWARANPLVLTGSGAEIDDDAADRIDDTDARLLNLLLAGLTDQAIGSQLRMSLRTVQRRVHALMDRTGAATRFQLGHEATRRGWLAPV
jgi:sugar-specific transcriptional regulator TrmB/DNA-binding CsgD family transcriptional regulator